MKKIRLRLLAIYGLAVLLCGALLYTSQEVQHAEDQVSRLERKIAQQEEEIRVLKAEWAYLNAPSRLEKLAKDHMGMDRSKPDQMMPEIIDAPAEIKEPEVEAQPVNFAPAQKEEKQKPAPVVPTKKPSQQPRVKTQKPEADFSSMLERIQKGRSQ